MITVYGKKKFFYVNVPALDILFNLKFSVFVLLFFILFLSRNLSDICVVFLFFFGNVHKQQCKMKIHQIELLDKLFT